MTLNFNYILVLSLFILTFVACQKDSSTENLLTAGSWKTESRMAVIQGVTINLNDSIHICIKDDLTRFKPDMSVEIDDGLLKCNPTDPQTFSLGPWILSENDTNLFFGGTTYEIDELTESRLNLTGPYSYLGNSGTIKITFIK